MKKTLKFALVMLAALFVLPVGTLTAAEKVKVEKLTVKTLPAETYPLLQKGKKLSLVWKSSEFAPSRGFKVGQINWKAETHLGEAWSYLKAQVQAIARPDGYYTLDLVVVEAFAGKVNWAGSITPGFYILEGTVKDAEGKIVAAIVTKDESETVGFDNLSMKPAVDKTVGAIASELFK